MATDLQTLYNNVRGRIFPQFPLYDENHRTELQDKILNHYLYREICCTPYAKWQIFFNRKLMEIMPYYNQLYELSGTLDNPFSNVNYKRVIENKGKKIYEKGTTDTTTSHSETNSNTSYTPGIDTVETNITTPQSEIETFLSNRYLSGATKTTTSGEDRNEGFSDSDVTGSIKRTGQDVDTNDDSTTETVIGKNGGKTYLELMLEYQEKIINIDMMIIEQLEDMFFMVL